MQKNRRTETSEAQIAREEYCVVEETGQESPAKVTAVVTALGAMNEAARARSEWPQVPGVPRLRARICDLHELMACVQEVLPIIERDESLHALSFVNPLRLATDHLGIAITPTVARYLRRALRGTLSFADTANPESVFRGLSHLRWVRRRGTGDQVATMRQAPGADDD